MILYTNEQIEAAAKSLERIRCAPYEWTDEQFEIWWNKDPHFVEKIRNWADFSGTTKQRVIWEATIIANRLHASILPAGLPVWVAMADDHDYDAMSQWLIGVYLTEEAAIAAGKADEDHYVKSGGVRDRHNVSIEPTTIKGLTE